MRKEEQEEDEDGMLFRPCDFAYRWESPRFRSHDAAVKMAVKSDETYIRGLSLQVLAGVAANAKVVAPPSSETFCPAGNCIILLSG